MNSVLKLLRKTGIAVVGAVVIVVGLILIPLPGPGLLVCLLGLIILGMEFDSAKLLAERLRSYLKNLVAKAGSGKPRDN